MKILAISAVFFFLSLGLLPHYRNERKTREERTERDLPFSIELNKNWEFREAGGSVWLPAHVPGTIHTDLMSCGKTGDPFYRLNERDQQWIDRTDWEYRSFFNLPDSMSRYKYIYLKFNGLDTYADVYLNGHLLASADNMFRSWEKECKMLLKQESNELRVILHSPVKKGLEKLESNGYPLPASMDQSFLGGLGDKGISPFSRKAPYHYGWDWGPRLVTSGIWKPVTLTCNNFVRMKDLNFAVARLEKKSAEINARFRLESDTASSGEAEILVNGKQVAHNQLLIKKGSSDYSVSFILPDPELWWPNGLGEQHLYSAEVKLINAGKTIDKIQQNFGIRKIELIREKDNTGTSFYFRVNGVPVFARGANYIPADVFLTRLRGNGYSRLISAAREANINMIRVWGGGIYEDDEFYDLCDKYGIMVWQDFIFACSLYPGDRAFLNNVRIEAEENVKRLRVHPSLALWCGNNEIRWAWGPDNEGWGWKQFYSKEIQDTIWKNYNSVFNTILPEAVSKHDPERSYWESSPMSDPRDKTEYTFDLKTGDVHYWNVWQGTKNPISSYNNVVGRFMSEYGFQSIPSLSSVKKFTIPADLSLESAVMASHQRSESGYKTMKDYMANDYIVPDEFESFIYMSQVLQAEAVRTAIEAHRRNKPVCMGSLYWQLNDCWPAASWSGIDYYGSRKALHYQVKRSYKPFLISILNDKDSIKIFTVSDSLKGFNAEINISLISFTGKHIGSYSLAAEIDSNSCRLQDSGPTKKYLMNADPASVVLHAELKTGERILAENNFYFKPVKDLNLPAPRIDYSLKNKGKKVILEISSSALVKNLFIDPGTDGGYFSDNYFDLIPGKKKTVEFFQEGNDRIIQDSVKFMSVSDTY